jgi:hypothetical protein
LTDLGTITKDQNTWPRGDKLWNVCRAIAVAEGYDKGPGTPPFDLNNPGDLSPGDEGGCPTAGPAEFHGGSRIIHFATPTDGWNALRAKIQRIADGHSRVYRPVWSWQKIASVYAGDSANWARNVAHALGVDVNSSLKDYLDSVSE